MAMMVTCSQTFGHIYSIFHSDQILNKKGCLGENMANTLFVCLAHMSIEQRRPLYSALTKRDAAVMSSHALCPVETLHTKRRRRNPYTGELKLLTDSHNSFYINSHTLS